MAEADYSNVKAFVFDAYGTLFDSGSAVSRCRDRVGNSAERLTALWRAKQIEYAWLRSLMGTYADFWRITGEALDYAMKACGLHDARLRSRLMDHYLSLDAYPEVRRTLEALKQKGYRTAVLSNGSPSMLISALKSAGLYKSVDRIYCVDGLQTYKPDQAVYKMAAEGLELEPCEIAFQSSNGWDVAGASKFGFVTAWINRFGAQREELPHEPALELTRLDELLGRLEPRGVNRGPSA